MSGYDNLLQIVNDGTPEPQRMAAMRGFARELDWTPSYELRGSYGVSAAENHLVVEHGLGQLGGNLLSEGTRSTGGARRFTTTKSLSNFVQQLGGVARFCIRHSG
jgi:hypothetical protein